MKKYHYAVQLKKQKIFIRKVVIFGLLILKILKHLIKAAAMEVDQDDYYDFPSIYDDDFETYCEENSDNFDEMTDKVKEFLKDTEGWDEARISFGL